mgnify:FL=1
MIDTRLLSGRDVSQVVYTALHHQIRSLKSKGITPSLAVILVGDDPSSKVYVKSKSRQFEKMGLRSETILLPEATSEAGLISFIEELNQDSTFHGVLVQLPLPRQIRSEKVIRAIAPKKDVDGFHPENLGLLTTGQSCFIPCTPKGILKILSHFNIRTKGQHIVVLGRSNIVGRPISILLSSKNNNGNGTVTLCHSGTSDLKTYTRQADILIVALGVPKMITRSFIKKGAVIVDVGIHRLPNNSEKGYEIVGDVDQQSVDGKASAIAPVPGGVGLMTIAMLVENTVEAAEIQSH